MGGEILMDVPKVNTKSSFYRFKFWTSPQGRKFLDVREHFTKADGEVQHTAKGMAIPVEMFGDMVEAFRAVQEKVEG